MAMVVVFPAPLPPSKAVIVPALISIDMALTAVTSSNVLVRFSVRIAKVFIALYNTLALSVR